MPSSIDGVNHSAARTPAASDATAGPGQYPDSPPADSEQRRTGEEAAIDPDRRRRRKRGRESWPHEPPRQRQRGGIDRDAAEHHERQARVPRTADVEKAEHLAGLGHAGEREAAAKQHPGEERERARPHSAPSQRPVTVAVTMPSSMNTMVAAIERRDRRLVPHRPWPLVQPPPSRVPAPTSRPDAIKSAGPRGTVTAKAVGATHPPRPR